MEIRILPTSAEEELNEVTLRSSVPLIGSTDAVIAVWKALVAAGFDEQALWDAWANHGRALGVLQKRRRPHGG